MRILESWRAKLNGLAEPQRAFLDGIALGLIFGASLGEWWAVSFPTYAWLFYSVKTTPPHGQ